MDIVGIIVLYAVVIGGMWFLLMRPQKKEQKGCRQCWHQWK